MRPIEVEAEVRSLTAKIEAADDLRQAIRQVREHIRAMDAAGRPVPAEIRELEQRLLVDCIAASQGR